jgi:hypothetical protein
VGEGFSQVLAGEYKRKLADAEKKQFVARDAGALVWGQVARS